MDTTQQKTFAQEYQNDIFPSLVEQLGAIQKRVEETLSRPHKPATRHPLMRELDRIELAFARIQAETFGRCQQCDTQINASRLQYIPYAEFCFACQRSKERVQAE